MRAQGHSSNLPILSTKIHHQNGNIYLLVSTIMPLRYTYLSRRAFYFNCNFTWRYDLNADWHQPREWFNKILIETVILYAPGRGDLGSNPFIASCSFYRHIRDRNFKLEPSEASNKINWSKYFCEHLFAEIYAARCQLILIQNITTILVISL